MRASRYVVSDSKRFMNPADGKAKLHRCFFIFLCLFGTLIVVLHTYVFPQESFRTTTVHDDNDVEIACPLTKASMLEWVADILEVRYMRLSVCF